MICKLCLKEKKLRNSHVISEFLYTSLYDEKIHRFNVLSTIPEITRKFEQKGIRERLLCDDCEQLISPFENYVRGVLYGGVKIGIEDKNTHIILFNIDYEKFKLFQLSVLWRSGVSCLAHFSSVKLGKRHEARLRKMILNKNPGEPHEFGTVNFVILNEFMKLQDDLIMSPDLVKIKGRRWYRFIFGGIFWVYFVSGHTPDAIFHDKFLTKEGTMILFKNKLDDMEFLKRWAVELKNQGKI